ncbi:MAG TPA: hypothetical protein DEA08_28625 [Planctomycetes bacterium]|nr:hypothetical protein [Planctomycetota bacterium]
MAIPLEAQAETQYVVPLRFKRAAFTYAGFETPELDTRGYEMGTRPSGWGSSDARGPMLGIMNGQEVRVKIERERLDEAAPVFVTSTNPAIVEITEPENGGPLPASGIFKCKALAGEGDHPVIQARLGSAEGPVLAELEPHTFSRLRIAITPHNVRIDGAGGNGTRASLTRLADILRRVRKIWRPCGIDFTINATINDNITLGSNITDTFDNASTWAGDIRQILGLQRTRLSLPAGTNDQSINMYMIDTFSNPGFVGYGISRDTADSIGSDTGIVINCAGVNGNEVQEERTARTVAHEIGHFLRLKHVEEKNAADAVEYTYGLWQLMYPKSWVPADARIKEFGNGTRARGHLITLKNHQHHSTDGECDTARRSIRDGNWT